jgi:hypothetical protein
VHGFWWSIFVRTRHLFEARFRRLSFWTTTTIAVVGFFLGARWIPILDAYRRQWWLIFVPPALCAAVAFMKAIEEHYEVQEKLAVSRGDELVDLRQQLRQRRDDAALARQRQETVSQLEELQNTGIGLSADMKRTYNPDRHRGMVNEWETSVAASLRARAPDHLNAFRLPIPVNPNRHLGDGERIIMEFDQRIGRLQQIIERIRG